MIQKKIINLIHPIDDLHIVDGSFQPCHVKRAFRRNPFWGMGAVGYYAAKDEKYFGLKLSQITLLGVIWDSPLIFLLSYLLEGFN